MPLLTRTTVTSANKLKSCRGNFLKVLSVSGGLSFSLSFVEHLSCLIIWPELTQDVQGSSAHPLLPQITTNLHSWSPNSYLYLFFVVWLLLLCVGCGLTCTGLSRDLLLSDVQSTEPEDIQMAKCKWCQGCWTVTGLDSGLCSYSWQKNLICIKTPLLLYKNSIWQQCWCVCVSAGVVCVYCSVFFLYLFSF